METAEALYLRAILNTEAGGGWSVEASGGTPPTLLRATRGELTVRLRLRFNGGDPLYVVESAPEPIGEILRNDRIRPARRKGAP